MVRVAKNKISIISNSRLNWKTVMTSRAVELGQVDVRRYIVRLAIFFSLTLVLREMTAEYRRAEDTRPIDHLLFIASKRGKDVIRINQNVVLARQVRCLGNEKRKEIGQQWNRPTRWPTQWSCRWGLQIVWEFQQDQTINTKMKGKKKAGYIRRVTKLCRSKLNGGSHISGLEAWAVDVLRCRAGIIDCRVEEQVSRDRNTRKILAMKRCLHARSNVARLYLPRYEVRGRGGDWFYEW